MQQQQQQQQPEKQDPRQAIKTADRATKKDLDEDWNSSSGRSCCSAAAAAVCAVAADKDRINTDKEGGKERENERTNERKTERKKNTRFTSGAVEVVDPARNGLLQGCSHDRRSDDGQRNTAALLEQQVFGQCFRVRVRIGTLAN